MHHFLTKGRILIILIHVSRLSCVCVKFLKINYLNLVSTLIIIVPAPICLQKSSAYTSIRCNSIYSNTILEQGNYILLCKLSWQTAIKLRELEGTHDDK